MNKWTKFLDLLKTLLAFLVVATQFWQAFTIRKLDSEVRVMKGQMQGEINE